MLLGYLVFFGLLSVQDQMSGPQAISYTEFKTQVANKNVAKILVLYNKPQPVRRLERLRRPFDTRSRPQWRSRRCINRAHGDEEKARALSQSFACEVFDSSAW
jgi:hypothetical protein